MEIITLDFETYYSKEYSLSRMTTEAYVRDDRFQVIGMGFQINDMAPMWAPAHQVEHVLKKLDLQNKAVLAHHAAFDGSILTWRYGVKPKLILDTLSMSRPVCNVECGGSLAQLARYFKVGEKGNEVVQAMGLRLEDFSPAQLQAYSRYCLNDVKLTHAIWEKLKAHFSTEELLLIDQTIRMFTEPQLEVDTAVLEAHKIALRKRADNLLQRIGMGCLPKEEALKRIRSNPQFADLLKQAGVEVPPMKISKTTSKLTYAFAKTDKGLLDLQEHPNPDVVDLVTARLGLKSSIEQTRTDALIGIAERGPLPIMLRYYAAHTGRFGGSDKINPQNLPRGGALRQSLRAPLGKVLVACDSSQIEARMVAWLAHQNDLLQAFREGRDVYSEFASEVYNHPVTKADTVERFVGKTCILGLGYSMGADRFKETLRIGQGDISHVIPRSEAERIVQLYRKKNHKIAAFWRLCQNMLREMTMGNSGVLNDRLEYDYDGIFLPSGFKVRYVGLRDSPEDGNAELVYLNNVREFRKFLTARVAGKGMDEVNWTKIYGGKTCENLTQAMARIVVSNQSVTIGRRYPVVLQVHDEVIACVNESEADEAKAFMEHTMSQPPVWAPDLPVACEAGVGYNYGECK